MSSPAPPRILVVPARLPAPPSFGCAMHPSAREQWAQSWARQIRSGGLLVTLVFPVNPDADLNVGPPFPVSPELYEQLLVTHGKLQKGGGEEGCSVIERLFLVEACSIMSYYLAGFV